jgi:hypothetical protein
LKSLITLPILCAGLFFSLPVQGQQMIPEPRQPEQAKVSMSQLSWSYTKPGKPAEVNIFISNHSDKMIRSVKIFVLTKDKKGIILQNFGSTLRPLVSRDTVGVGQAKQLHFKNAFDNTRIAETELKQAIIEYENGALEILNK